MSSGRQVSHKDTLIVSINTPDGPFTVLNVYNDSESHAAVSHLLNVTQHLPPISMMCGDFNLRHPSWDKRTRDKNENPPHGAKATELLDLAAELQLLLVNDENGPATWQSNNRKIPARTLDLVWRRGDYEIRDFKVQDMDKHRSDHSPLAWKVVAGQGPEAEATIGRVSETSWAFTLGVAKLVASFPTEFATGEDVERTGEALFAGIQELWKQHATVPNKTGHSRSWWTSGKWVRLL
ncbi:hypothetical protein FOMPIDRAFT_1049586 [Fomitopsis schrenkii]|uniref:Endonuclease/exonuclease/phosphatase domain-containing protein n=1 Tax=Fomitopsis schrenkii TaxID=2126942 RepID=S8EB90_FOMSC|nr:hypothetical protein FOMPIDRAFT_1049586 [Fomitopsis schrenkii]